LFRNKIDIEELESYNKINKRGELSRKEDIVQKFRLLRPLGKLYNILVYSCSTSALVKRVWGASGKDGSS
jgi:hypothetical protein